MKQKKQLTSYLDVSEFILKEHSPLFKPRSIEQPIEVIILYRIVVNIVLLSKIICLRCLITILLFIFYIFIQINHQTYELSHDVSPVLEGKMNFAMTPLFEKTKIQPFKQSHFDELQSFSLDANIHQHKTKKPKRSRPRIPSSWYIVENELENIIEENDSEYYYINDSDVESEYSNQDDSQNLEDNEQISDQQGQQVQNQKLSNTLFQPSIYQFKCPEWQATNPKKQLISKLKGILTNTQIKTNQEKIAGIKEIFCKYLCEYEKFYFEQSLTALQKQAQAPAQLVQILIKGIQQTFKRQIKGLSFEKRRLKLLRYLDKKKRRVWRKKVSYDCRKKVADGRLRIKGKFVTYQQACQQLGLASIEGYTPDQIKDMLYRKLEHS